jgi:hypothetical protein
MNKSNWHDFQKGFIIGSGLNQTNASRYSGHSKTNRHSNADMSGKGCLGYVVGYALGGALAVYILYLIGR